MHLRSIVEGVLEDAVILNLLVEWDLDDKCGTSKSRQEDRISKIAIEALDRAVTRKLSANFTFSMGPPEENLSALIEELPMNSNIGLYYKYSFGYLQLELGKTVHNI